MAEGDEPRVIAEFSDYAGMLDALRKRVTELGVNGERFDEYAGLPKGYLSKLIGANPVRKLGMVSMGPLLNAAGVYCWLLEDQQATERLKSRVKPRNGSFARTTYTLRVVTDRQWLQIQKLGRVARWQKIPKAQRRAIMREVRAARERKRRPKE
jgi:hypothetical protein